MPLREVDSLAAALSNTAFYPQQRETAPLCALSRPFPLENPTNHLQVCFYPGKSQYCQICRIPSEPPARPGQSLVQYQLWDKYSLYHLRNLSAAGEQTPCHRRIYRRQKPVNRQISGRGPFGIGLLESSANTTTVSARGVIRTLELYCTQRFLAPLIPPVTP